MKPRPDDDTCAPDETRLDTDHPAPPMPSSEMTGSPVSSAPEDTSEANAVIESLLSHGRLSLSRGNLQSASDNYRRASQTALAVGDPATAARALMTFVEDLSSHPPSEQSSSHYLELLRSAYLDAHNLLADVPGTDLKERLDHCAELVATVSLPPPVLDFITADESTTIVLRKAQALATGSTSILILGETGTGKTTLGRKMHAWSQRPGVPVVIECSETDVDNIVPYFGEVDSTVILKEIGWLGLRSQKVLLDLIAQAPLPPAGTWIIATSSDDLPAAVKAGAFRQELYDYLSSVTFALAPLSIRDKDTLALAQHFLEEANKATGKSVLIQPDALHLLTRLNLPGNFADLRNLLESTVAEADKHTVITAEMVEVILLRQTMPPTLIEPWANLTLQDELRHYEQRLIQRALQTCEGRITDTSRLLNVAHQALTYKIENKHQSLEKERKPQKRRQRKPKDKKDAGDS